MRTLDSLCQFIVDCPHSTAPDEGVGFPLIRTPNIERGYFNLEGVHRVSKDAYDKRNIRAVPQDDDLILAREAPAGNVAIVQNGNKVCLGQRTVLIRPDSKKVHPMWLNYYLNAPEQRHALLKNANGATVPHVNMPIIRSLPVVLPNRKTQECIAGILSAYDKLIENNRKQIKLLEEAAQRLYKEWFIDLKFPSHETTPIDPTTNLPEGWSVKLVDEILDVKYGKNLAMSEVSLTGMFPVYGASGINGYYEKYNIENKSVLITSRGNGSGHVFRTTHSRCFATNNVFVVRPKDLYQHCSLAYLFELLKTIPFKQVCSGSAQPQLTNAGISKLTALIPSKEAILSFGHITQPLLDKQDILNEDRRMLQEARDRLLPKLMSGEIEV